MAPRKQNAGYPCGHSIATGADISYRRRRSFPPPSIAQQRVATDSIASGSVKERLLRSDHLPR